MLNDRAVSGVNVYNTVHIGDIICTASSKARDGFIFCDGREISRKKYNLLFEEIGTTWGVGDGVNTFNIPDMTDRVPQGASTKHKLGTRIKAGLPNIIGSYRGGQDGVKNINVLEADGAFYGDDYISSVDDSSNNRNTTFNKLLRFDATKGETYLNGSLKDVEDRVFGKSETVQTNANAFYFYIKAYETGDLSIVEKTEINDKNISKTTSFSSYETQKRIDYASTPEATVDLILKYCGALGELRYFPDTKYHRGFLYCDGSIFMPNLFPEFFEFWKEHFEKKCGYDSHGFPKLPDFRKMYIRGSGIGDTPFEFERESLPNIVGTLKGGNYQDGTPNTGAFRAYSGGSDRNDGGDSYGNRLNFNAHWSNSTYGRNGKQDVVVNNVNSYIYIKAV